MNSTYDSPLQTDGLQVVREAIGAMGWSTANIVRFLHTKRFWLSSEIIENAIQRLKTTQEQGVRVPIVTAAPKRPQHSWSTSPLAKNFTKPNAGQDNFRPHTPTNSSPPRRSTSPLTINLDSDDSDDDNFQPASACIKRLRDDCSPLLLPIAKRLSKGKACA
ncbi:hypothetical protein K450DRAFT_241848 [Umbelopsis ramanniana AG]|uniref:Uncharacterized protein n=1 Tax=Umbelopsis ramanniana AG TaxID=1314678 RepID=A0AAD5HF27_UMBRA|nr:uncharacterized protein K450DRAFT_241848 [Umbelopsis ramanniana AG]KAI8579618.1 hypothetical protein K450DRAFT_241848 [Umbelopsis ramanniana AG]